MRDEEFISCEKIIASLAYRWVRLLPRSAMYDAKDLISEGWIIYIKCLKGYDEDYGVKFTTYLYASVYTQFIKIAQTEARKCLPNRKEGYDCVELPTKVGETPDRQVMLIQALNAIAEVSADFAKMIVEGVPEELVIQSRRLRRHKARRNRFDNPSFNVTYPNSMIEDYFGVSLKELEKIVNNYI